MDLKKFKEMYLVLEEKAKQIMEVHGIGHYDLEGFEIEEHQGKTLINIKTSIYLSGCGTESEWITFELNEMDNNIEYFQNKYENKRKEKMKREELNKKLAKEAAEKRERAEYERLKNKFR